MALLKRTAITSTTNRFYTSRRFACAPIMSISGMELAIAGAIDIYISGKGDRSVLDPTEDNQEMSQRMDKVAEFLNERPKTLDTEGRIWPQVNAAELFSDITPLTDALACRGYVRVRISSMADARALVDFVGSKRCSTTDGPLYVSITAGDAETLSFLYNSGTAFFYTVYLEFCPPGRKCAMSEGLVGEFLAMVASIGLGFAAKTIYLEWDDAPGDFLDRYGRGRMIPLPDSKPMVQLKFDKQPVYGHLGSFRRV